MLERGDLLLVPFPFTDLPVTKYRPAVVLSKASFNQANGNSVLAMITSAQRSSWPSDLPINDRESSGLRAPSVVRWKLFTLGNELISRTVGTLGRADRAALRHALREVLA